MSAKKQPTNQTANNYAKYSGLAFQILGFLCISLWIGYSLDKWFSMNFPLFTLLFSVFGLVGMMYWLIKSVGEK